MSSAGEKYQDLQKVITELNDMVKTNSDLIGMGHYVHISDCLQIFENI